MKYLSVIAITALVIGAIAASVWWKVYVYQDCKNVGHSTLYCVFKKY